MNTKTAYVPIAAVSWRKSPSYGHFPFPWSSASQEHSRIIEQMQQNQKITFTVQAAIVTSSITNKRKLVTPRPRLRWLSSRSKGPCSSSLHGECYQKETQPHSTAPSRALTHNALRYMTSRELLEVASSNNIQERSKRWLSFRQADSFSPVLIFSTHCHAWKDAVGS